MARVSIIGAGYVGLCTGVVFAKHGHDVTIVEVMPERLASLRAGKVPFFEPGVQEALREALDAGRLRATDDHQKAVHDTDVTFLCVGTPQGADGAIDLAFVRGAARDVGKALASKKDYHVVVTKSTVVPGTAEGVVGAEVAVASGKRPGKDFGVASNPEFLREGSAMKDALAPDRIVVGAIDRRAADVVWSLYAAFSCPKITTDPKTAEMIKYAANAFLATKIAFANEMANVCERLGIDYYEVADGIGHDFRINPHFLRAGVGFGGSCFPKDVAAIAHVARSAGAPSGLLDAVLENNEKQPLVAVRLLEEEVGALEGKRIALLGLAFKPDTDDVRETRALPIWQALTDAGADVVCYDPEARDTFRRLAPEATVVASAQEALTGADGAIVQTEWAELKALPPAKIVAWMRSPVLVDGRRTFDPHAMRAAGVRYRAVGLGKR